VGMTQAIEKKKFIHDLRQPLNVINLAVSNLRVRLSDRLTERDQAYLEVKLARIEQQVVRITEMLSGKGDAGASEPVSS
jgi:nitrogen fixation/metabolism regulation signal transduction histidine kinase